MVEKFFRPSPEPSGLRVELTDLYDSHECKTCNTITLADDSDEYDKVLDEMLRDIHSGAIAEGVLPLGYFNYVNKRLSGAITEALGNQTFGSDDYRNSLKLYFDENIYAFSAAKSFSVLKLYNGFLLDEKGNTESYSKFKNKVLEVDPTISRAHLETEYIDALSSAQMADKWETLKNYPALQYSTVGDDRVSPEHAALHGLIIETSDPLMDKIFPPKRNRCRCNMLPAATGAKPSNREQVKQLASNLKTKPYFKHHVGKEKIVYSDEHPYYKNVDGKIQNLQAERNYGMRSPQQVYAQENLPTVEYLADKEAANNWWQTKAGSLRGSFDIRSIDDINFSCSNKLRTHILEENTDSRHRFLHKLPEVLQSPDEVWVTRGKKGIETRYIKYYDDFPMIAIADDTSVATLFQAERDGKINVSSLYKSRSGVLKYRK